MHSYKSLSLVLLVSTVISACGGASVRPSSSTGALTANATLNVAPQRPFDRQMLMVTGLSSLNEFIRSDVRSRVDEEAVGDVEYGSASGPEISSPPTEPTGEQAEAKNGTKPQQPEEQEQQGYDEDTSSFGASDSGKFLWAKKSFGEALKSNQAVGGVIVLYADENFYDINSLMRFIEEGRSRIVQESELSNDRVLVMFGGYRGLPQVEYWLVPYGAPMPELKVEDREKASEPEN